MLRLLTALVLAGCAALAAAQPKSDWERQNEARLAAEEKTVLPPYPKKDNLVEIYVSAATDFKYFIDASTLTVSPGERVIRYVIVARSPNGAENVRFEAIRCPFEYRTLAVGQPDGTWGGRAGDWREITRGSSLSWPYALSRYFFCPHRDPIRSVAEGKEALAHGVHPAVEVQRSMGGSD